MSRLSLLVLMLTCASSLVAGPLVIAHRGASAYLPEHTLPAVAMAHAMGADYIEQDVVLSRDEVPVILHDVVLEHTTDVAVQFPGRARADGHYYVTDFSLAEIKQLQVGERRDDRGVPVFPDRFPGDVSILRVPTLEEEIQLIQGLNRSTNRNVGIYVELKRPGFHQQEDKDIVGAVLQQLYAYGYRDAEDRIYLQCYDADTLRFLNDHTEIRLIQLLHDKDLNEQRAQAIARYADGVGVSIQYLADAPEFVAYSQAAGLPVHAYTFRADQLPRGISSYTALLELYINEMRIDGLFTDHPDLTVRFLRETEMGSDL
jgi:glycerophosphoryl diester phosphodiesterase